MKCDTCGAEIEIGMYPFCKGTPESHGQTTMAYKTALFPFIVNHVTGKPMEISDMGHLRRVERDYGVTFSAFSKSNVKDLDPIKDLPKYRENMREYEG